MAQKHNQNLLIVAIVGIVAIVALMVFSNPTGQAYEITNIPDRVSVSPSPSIPEDPWIDEGGCTSNADCQRAYGSSCYMCSVRYGTCEYIGSRIGCS